LVEEVHVRVDCTEPIVRCWRCRCDCGREKVVSRSHLKAGTVSCGCYRLRVLRLGRHVAPGDVFGSFRVIREAEQRSAAGHLQAHVRCRCGAELLVRNDLLRRRHQNALAPMCKSCDRRRRKREGLILVQPGRRFGKLTALRYCGLQVGASSVLVVRCTCGKVGLAFVAHLLAGKVRSCGRCQT
jgi:hypothetical protein